jgi:hypothetical protein
MESKVKIAKMVGFGAACFAVGGVVCVTVAGVALCVSIANGM